MAANTYEKNKILYKSGEKIRELGLIVKGRVLRKGKHCESVLESGNLMGIMDCAECMVHCDYITLEDTTVYSFPYRTTEDLKKIFETQPDYGSVFLLAANKEMQKMLAEYGRLYKLTREFYSIASDTYRNYQMLCTQYQVPEGNFSIAEYLRPMDEEYRVENWRLEYFDSLSRMDLNDLKGLFKVNALNIGNILWCSQLMSQLYCGIEGMYGYLKTNRGVLLNEEKQDIFQLYFKLIHKVVSAGGNADAATKQADRLVEFIGRSNMYDLQLVRGRVAEYKNFDFSNPSGGQASSENKEPVQHLDNENCLKYIFDYADIDEEQLKQFTGQLYEYRDLSDPYSTEDEVRKLRRALCKTFYECYKAVVRRTLQEQEIPAVIKMFLNFGFMDTSFAGDEAANGLFRLCNRLSLCRSSNVYTLYEWLKSIYEGKNEPSISEFDMDYPSFLRDAVKTGAMTKSEATQRLNDQWEKVSFEIDNMFMTTSKIVYGRVTNFQPVLSERDIITSVEKMLVTANKIEESFNALRSVDYDLFYRKVLFSDEAHGIHAEYIQEEILPNVILLPLAGSKGMMWQVTAGAKSNTPARFMLPILTASDVDDILLENAGRYRWEMCRKIQGVHWNDVTDPSLTSEYSDYIQYYRKNYELSPEAKEKIKLALTKAKNNYRDVFIRDYEVWIKYEARGSFRLNKVSREILFKYCPFNAEIRNSLKDNPMYKEMISRYDILMSRQKRRIEGVYDKYQKAGGEMTEALQKNLDYYDL